MSSELPTFNLENRSVEELVSFIKSVAENLNFGRKEKATWGNYLDKNYPFKHFESSDTETLPELPDEMKALLNELPKKDQDYLRAIKATGSLTPDRSLLLIAVVLYRKHLSAQLNKLPHKLNEYYYEKMLGEKRRSATPVRAYVCFETSKTFDRATVEQGWKLDAGRDKNNKKIVFSTERELSITGARVEQVRTLYYDPTSYFSGVFKDDCYQNGTFTRNGYRTKEIGQEENYFEAFGRTPLYEQKWNELAEEEFAEFGFALTSSVLYLKGGVRTITVTIPFSCDQGRINQVINELNKAHFTSILKKSVYLTSETAWFNAQDVEFSADNVEAGNNYNTPTITIKVVLSPNALPVSPLSDFHALPGIKLGLKPDFKHNHDDTSITAAQIKNSNHIELLSLLSQLKIENKEISIEVDVSDFRDVVLHNSSGRLNSKQPFEPFGSVIRLHEVFAVGSEEVFQKKLSSLSIKSDVDYGVAGDDFAEYFDNSSYPNVAQLGSYILSINSIGGNATNLVGGFNTAQFHVRSDEYGINDFTEVGKPWQKELPEYDPAADFGYIEITIMAPRFPFGHGIRSNQFTKQPLVPELRNLKIDYTAVAVKKEFYQLSPFGKKKANGKLSLIENIFSISRGFSEDTTEGVLLIGVSNLQAGKNTLYVELMGSSLQYVDSSSQIEAPAFYTICENKLEPLIVLSSEIDDFGRSGTVELYVPEKKLQGNTVLPAELSWIVVIAKDKPDYYGLINGIYLNAVPAKLEGSFGEDEVPQISAGKNAGGKIGKVFQPFATRKGRSIEDRYTYNLRLQREIRHGYGPGQNYLFTKQDISRYIKYHFPEVFACRTKIEGEKLKIILLPVKNGTSLRPVFSVNFLAEVKDKLRGCLPFFKKENILICNPRYAVFQLKLMMKADFDVNKVPKLQDSILHILTPWSDEKKEGEIWRPGDEDLKTLLSNCSVPFENLEDRRWMYVYFSQGFLYGSEFGEVSPEEDLVFIPDQKKRCHEIGTVVIGNLSYIGFEGERKPRNPNNDF